MCWRSYKGPKTACFLVEPSYGADVALVVDYATTPDVINQLSTFISSIIDGLNISSSGVHVALITYGANATIVFPFNELQGPLLNRDAVKNLVDTAKPQSGSPKINKALQLAKTKLFTTEAGARPGVPKVTFSALIRIKKDFKLFVKSEGSMIC